MREFQKSSKRLPDRFSDSSFDNSADSNCFGLDNCLVADNLNAFGAVDMSALDRKKNPTRRSNRQEFAPSADMAKAEIRQLPFDLAKIEIHQPPTDFEKFDLMKAEIRRPKPFRLHSFRQIARQIDNAYNLPPLTNQPNCIVDI